MENHNVRVANVNFIRSKPFLTKWLDTFMRYGMIIIITRYVRYIINIRVHQIN